MCHSTNIEVRGELAGICSLPSPGTQGSNSDFGGKVLLHGATSLVCLLQFKVWFSRCKVCCRQALRTGFAGLFWRQMTALSEANWRFGRQH